MYSTSALSTCPKRIPKSIVRFDSQIEKQSSFLSVKSKPLVLMVTLFQIRAKQLCMKICTELPSKKKFFLKSCHILSEKDGSSIKCGKPNLSWIFTFEGLNPSHFGWVTGEPNFRHTQSHWIPRKAKTWLVVFLHIMSYFQTRHSILWS